MAHAQTTTHPLAELSEETIRAHLEIHRQQRGAAVVRLLDAVAAVGEADRELQRLVAELALRGASRSAMATTQGASGGAG